MKAQLVHLTSVGGDVYVVRPFELPPGHPDQGLPRPGRPVDPGYGVEGGEKPAIPGVPDNSLPTTPPPTVPPGSYLVMVKGADGKWKWATSASMPTPLPEPPPTAQPKA